jgi:hypothetical protein
MSQKHTIDHDEEINKKTKEERVLKHLEIGTITDSTMFQILFPEESMYMILDNGNKEPIKNVSFDANVLMKVLKALGVRHEDEMKE